MKSNEFSPHRATVLLTGASGVVGSALRPLLTRRYNLLSLRHQAPVGGECYAADVLLPRYGLSDALYRDLASRVDIVVNAAAVTSFAVDAPYRVNVASAEAACAFAAAADARLLHLSTAFVARDEAPPPELLSDAASTPHFYLASKQAGERIVRDSGVPAAIARLAIVLGDSKTGAIARPQGLHQVLEAVLGNQLPMVPFGEGSSVDFIPQDVAAAALLELVDAGVPAGEYWLAAGKSALTTERMSALCEAVAAEFGRAVARPRVVSHDMVMRLIKPVFIDPLPARVRRRFDGLLALSTLFAEAREFPSSLPELLGQAAPSAASQEAALAATLRHLMQARQPATPQFSGAAP